MSNKNLKNRLTLTATTLALGLGGASLIAQADSNPFGLSQLPGGYMVVADKGAEGKCGEAKCGAEKASSKMTEGQCGGQSDTKSSEASCGGNKGGEKSSEAKCGEAKCGGSK
ncbi:MAG: low-complexity protein [Candidatus Thiodiazotropha sp.]